MADEEGPKRDELLGNLRAKLRALFTSGTPDAEDKGDEVVGFAAEYALGAHSVWQYAVAYKPTEVAGLVDEAIKAAV